MTKKLNKARKGLSLDGHQAKALRELVRYVYADEVRNYVECEPDRRVDHTGRKCTEPVKTISLAWHPDEAPSKAP